MEKFRLISMTDFVLQNVESKTMKLSKIADYANFLKQPLTLGMFVPCDDDGNVLEEPSKDMWDNFIISHFEHFNESYTYCFNYQKAKLKVLFNGFQVRNQSTYSIVSNKDGAVWVTCRKSKNIESLIPYNLDLTVSF